MRPKKKRDRDAKAIKQAVKSGEIQTDPIEDYYLDPYGRPIVQMLNEAPVEVLGNRDRDLAADALNVLGVVAREGVGLLPLAGEALDAGEIAYASKYGTDYYGDEISPELLGGLTAAGYLVPNIIERPLKGFGRAIKKGYKNLKNKLTPKPGSVQTSTETIFTDSAGNRISRQEWDRQASPEDLISEYGRDMYSESVSDPMVSQTKQNLMQFVRSDEYKDRVANAFLPLVQAENDAILKFNRDLRLPEEPPMRYSDATEREAKHYAETVQNKVLRNLRGTDQFIVDAQEFQDKNLSYWHPPGSPVQFSGLGYRESDHHLTTSKGPSIVLAENAPRSTAAHEFGHTSMDKRSIEKAAESVGTPELTAKAEQELKGKKGMYDQLLTDYYSDPDEIRARAFEVIDASRNIGVTTDDMVDYGLKALKTGDRSMLNSIPTGLTTLLEYFDPDEVRSYLKKVFSLMPVAGAGAVAATRMGSGGEEPTSYAKGGIMKAVKKSAKSAKIKPKKRNYKKEYKKFQSSKKMKKYRAKLNKYNRKKGTYGNGDRLDASHKGGKIVKFESQSKNRGRKEKSRLKKK